MPFPCFDLCLTAWRESEIVFHGTVVGAAILYFFATGVFLDDLEVDAFLFGIVTMIALTDFNLPSWNTGRRLVALRCCSAWGWLRTAAAWLCCARELVRAAGLLLLGYVARAGLMRCAMVLAGLI